MVAFAAQSPVILRTLFYSLDFVVSTVNKGLKFQKTGVILDYLLSHPVDVLLFQPQSNPKSNSATFRRLFPNGAMETETVRRRERASLIGPHPQKRYARTTRADSVVQGEEFRGAETAGAQWSPRYLPVSAVLLRAALRTSAAARIISLRSRVIPLLLFTLVSLVSSPPCW